MSRATEALDQLARLHREIDERVAVLARRHAARLRCRRGCCDCCLDGLSVRPIEAERIRRACPDLLSRGRPHPPGRCAFLDGEGGCRIYAVRPTVCRSQGLPLRVVFEDEAGALDERRDICPLNLDGGEPLADLDEEDCWLVGPEELRLESLDRTFREASGSSPAGDESPRIALRSLFRRS